MLKLPTDVSVTGHECTKRCLLASSDKVVHMIRCAKKGLNSKETKKYFCFVDIDIIYNHRKLA